MTRPSYKIPERITAGEQQYLNCKVGESVRPEQKDHTKVLDRFESTLADSFLQVYYEYPDTGPGDAHYIDVIVLSPATGVVLLNILSLNLENIESIKGPDWRLVTQPESIRPITSIHDAAVGIRRQFTEREELRDENLNPSVPIQSYIALLDIKSNEFINQFPDIDTNEILFQDDFIGRDRGGKDPLFDQIQIGEADVLTDEDLRNVLATLKFSGRISGGGAECSERTT